MMEVVGLLARGSEIAARPDIRERIAAAPPATPPPGPDRAGLLHLLHADAA